MKGKETGKGNMPVIQVKRFPGWWQGFYCFLAEDNEEMKKNCNNITDRSPRAMGGEAWSWRRVGLSVVVYKKKGCKGRLGWDEKPNLGHISLLPSGFDCKYFSSLFERSQSECSSNAVERMPEHYLHETIDFCFCNILGVKIPYYEQSDFWIKVVTRYILLMKDFSHFCQSLHLSPE